MTIENELKDFILASDLKDNQKALWNNLINSITAEDANTILETIKEDKESLLFLTNNLEEKTKAIKNNDEESWNNAIDQEKNFIIKKDN